MRKIQVQTELDPQVFLQQLETSELEVFSREINKLLIQRRAKDKRIREAELLQKLNEECVLPNHELQLFYFLSEKRKEKELPKEELKQLFQLIHKEEKLRLKRIKILGELAQLKNTSINKIIVQLGIATIPNTIKR